MAKLTSKLTIHAGPRSANWRGNVAGAAAYITVAPAMLVLAVGRWRREPFVRFHAMQCLVLAAFGIAGRVTLHFCPYRPFLVSGLYTLVLVAVWAMAVVMAAQGTALWIPIVSPVARSLAEGGVRRP